MDFRDTAEEAAFRQEVRDFIEKECPPSLRGGPTDEDEGLLAPFQPGPELRRWLKKLAERRWIAPAWPKEYGGAGLSVIEQFIFSEEMALARAPRPFSIATMIVGPTLIVYGSEEQKRRYLPEILQGEVVWCQGYSEPNAGSDLASLQTRAVREGDDYIINGHKVWTTGAHAAKWMILLARTDPDAPKHRGISYFIVDMKSPGVTVQPLLNMADTHEFNQVYFDNVRVPKENLIGEENRGWYMAMTTLDFERSGIGGAIGQRQTVEDLVRYAREHAGDGTSMLGQAPLLRLELTERLIEAEVATMLARRIVSMQARGQVPNYEASAAKVYSTELNQRIAHTGVRLLGLYGQLDRTSRWAPLRGRIKHMYLRAVANTIEGGTSEIQRNIIATRGLGLPRG